MMLLRCPILLTLSAADIERATRVAKLRTQQSLGRLPNHGYDGDSLTVHIPGALGELVFCKVTGWQWNESVNTFKQADVGRDIQVRCAPCKAKWPPSGFGNLFVRHDDDPSHRYVLVVGNAPNFAVKGWMYGREAMHPRWWKRIGNRDPAWLVPSCELNRELGELLVDAHLHQAGLAASAL